jgi:hypothetical protein
MHLAMPHWRGNWRPGLMTRLLGLIIIAQLAPAIRLNIWSAPLPVVDWLREGYGKEGPA